MSTYLTFEEAREALGVSEEDLKRMVSMGQLRAYRKGKRMAFRVSDVEELHTSRGFLGPGVTDDASADLRTGEGALLSFEQTMRALGIQEEELKRMVCEGEIRAFRDDNRMSFRASDVQALRERLGLPGCGAGDAEPADAQADAAGDIEILADVEGAHAAPNSSAGNPAEEAESGEFVADLRDSIGDSARLARTAASEPPAEPPPPPLKKDGLPVARLDSNPPVGAGISSGEVLFVLVVAAAVAALLALLA